MIPICPIIYASQLERFQILRSSECKKAAGHADFAIALHFPSIAKRQSDGKKELHALIKSRSPGRSPSNRPKQIDYYHAYHIIIYRILQVSANHAWSCIIVLLEFTPQGFVYPEAQQQHGLQKELRLGHVHSCFLQAYVKEAEKSRTKVVTVSEFSSEESKRSNNPKRSDLRRTALVLLPTVVVPSLSSDSAQHDSAVH